MGGVLEFPNGIKVRPEKQWYEVMVGVNKDREIAGKFLRELNPSQVKNQLVQRKHFENRKSFSEVRKHR